MKRISLAVITERSALIAGKLHACIKQRKYVTHALFCRIYIFTHTNAFMFERKKVYICLRVICNSFLRFPQIDRKQILLLY